MDYFYMNERDREEGANPLVIVTDEDTGDKYARAVGRKGVGEHGENGLADPRYFPQTQVFGGTKAEVGIG